MPRVIGRMRRLNAPASTRRVAGFQSAFITAVETTMNQMMTAFSFFAIAGWNVFKKDTAV